jgi:hypothetical protein
MSRADWLFAAAILAAFVVVFWVLFARIFAEAIGGVR